MTGNRTSTATPLHTESDFRSIAMYTLQEALARDRMRETERRARSAQPAHAVAGERRWHRAATRRFASR
jgi:hypothetical protein